MNRWIDRLSDDTAYVFSLAHGQHAITGTLVSQDTVLHVRGQISGTRGDAVELFLINPEHVVHVRLA